MEKSSYEKCYNQLYKVYGLCLLKYNRGLILTLNYTISLNLKHLNITLGLLIIFCHIQSRFSHKAYRYKLVYGPMTALPRDPEFLAPALEIDNLIVQLLARRTYRSPNYRSDFTTS